MMTFQGITWLITGRVSSESERTDLPWAVLHPEAAGENFETPPHRAWLPQPKGDTGSLKPVTPQVPSTQAALSIWAEDPEAT